MQEFRKSYMNFFKKDYEFQVWARQSSCPGRFKKKLTGMSQAELVSWSFKKNDKHLNFEAVSPIKIQGIR